MCPQTDPPDFLTVNEVARQLRVTPLTLRRMLTSASFPGIKVGHVWRIRRQDLLEWMDRNHNQKSLKK